MSAIRFLVVEDDPALAENLLELLALLGFPAELATSAAAARQLASQRPFEVALVDLGLPDARGVDLVQDLKTRLPYLMAIVLTGQPTLHSARNAIRSGATAYLLKDGDPRELEAVLRRAAEQAGLARALRESEARYALIVERAPLGIALVRDDRYAFVNERFARIFGIDDPHSLVGARIEDVYHEDERAAVRTRWTSSTAEPFQESYTVRSARRRDGRLVDLSVMRSRLELEGRSAVQLLVRDVTEENRLTRELEDARAQVEEKRRLAALGEMVAGIAHEVRNPLQGVSWGLNDLRALCVHRPEALEAIDKIERGKSEIEAIVAQVLDYARPMKLESFAFPVRELLESTREDLAGFAKAASVDLQVQLDGTPDEVVVDPLKIKQALVNLVRNAVEASPPGSRVVLRARTDGERAPITFEVEDEGSGIRPDLADRIYLPFVTTKVKGTGLGLAITRRIVEAHGGSIALVSREPRGTVARVALPATVKAA